MSARVGALRSGRGLDEAVRRLATLGERTTAVPGVPGWETTDLLTVATAITAAAGAREETRGCHWRVGPPRPAEPRRRRPVPPPPTGGGRALRAPPGAAPGAGAWGA